MLLVSSWVVHVASQSDLKLKAVRAALPDCYRVEGHDSKSDVGEQPVGLDMIEQGARNRLKGINHLPCIAFETGVIQTANSWSDLTCAILRTNLGDFYAWSFDHLQTVPQHALDKWQLLSKAEQQTMTLGSIIVEKLIEDMTPDDWSWDSQLKCAGMPSRKDPQHITDLKSDWYRAVGGSKSRQGILRILTEQVWTQFVRNCECMPQLQVKAMKHNQVDFIDIQHNLSHQGSELAECVRLLTERLVFDTVVIADARGFIFAGIFLKNKIRVVMARKPGKLPGEVHTVTYAKEYGTDELCIEHGAIPDNSHVLIIDDLIATGGSMQAIASLVETKFNSKVVAFVCPFAIETAPGTLLATKIPLEKLRFAQTQLGLPRWIRKQEVTTQSDTISIVPPSLHTLLPEHRATVEWKQFAASSNIKFRGQEFKDKHVKVYMNTTKEAEMFEVLSILKILHRKDPKSVTLIVPFVEQSTQDRLIYEDQMETLAQIDTLAKMIGKHKVQTCDLHCEQTQLNFYDLRNDSIVLDLYTKFKELHPDCIVVFPDDGAAKRFSKLLHVDHYVTFRKTRGFGDVRTVATEDKTEEGVHYVICDDLLRSGSTLRVVANYLLEMCKAASVAALFAHAPFEPQAARNLEVFKNKIWTSNSCVNVPSEWVKYRL